MSQNLQVVESTEIPKPTDAEIIAECHAALHLLQERYEESAGPFFRIDLLEAAVYDEHWMHLIEHALEISAPFAHQCKNETQVEGEQ